MTHSRFPQRRNLLIGLATIALVPLAGCMTRPLRPVNADGSYCHRRGKTYRPTLTCTPTSVPSDFVEGEAKQFIIDPASLTVYVLRRSWGDASLVVPVTVDGEASASTIPASLVRLRLKPGLHNLSAQWEGQTVDISVAGRAGDLRVVELIGSSWAWGNSFKWKPTQLETVKSRARSSKLVADLDLRR